MDALALLCTLHADGPATWRRLRESECHSLPDLARFQPAELAEILGGTLAGAKRFLREARHLEERVGGHWLEHEEGAAAPVASSSPVVADPAANVRPEDLPTRDQQILDEVLRAWRDEDERESGADEEPEAAGVAAPNELPAQMPSPAELSAQARSAAELAAQAQAAPQSPSSAATAPLSGELAPGLLEGLDAPSCERLRGAGVRTLDALLAAELGELALRAGLAFSRLYRWRALVQRQRRAESEPRARISPAEVPPPSPTRDLLQIPARAPALHDRRPRWSPVEEGAAGPFA